jgi:hypothetical protein
MEELFSTGRIVDLILVGVAVETVALYLLCRKRGRFAPFAATILSGAALMLALRAALTGAPWTVVAGWMLVGLAAHVGDLVLRRPALRPDAWPQAEAKRNRNNAFWGAFTRR